MNELDLNIGAQVFCTDGKCGKLAKVAIDPDTMQATHLIMEEGLLLKRSRVFPISSVERAAVGEIYLSIETDELVNYPEYREENIERPALDYRESGVPATWLEVPYAQSAAPSTPKVREKVRYGVPEDSVVLERGTPINGLEGQIGKLDHLLVEADSGEITRLVVQQGLLFSSQRMVPASKVESIARISITLTAWEEELNSLPKYEADDYESREVDMSEYTENNNPGHLAAGELADDLVTRVATALLEDPRTSEAVIEVINERGMITLTGDVDDIETREAAEEIATEQQGVVTVANLLRVSQ